MFENVGGKIKTFSMIYGVLGVFSACIMGLYCMAERLLLQGLIVLVFGSLGAWFSSLLVYAFGHLVENSDYIKLSLSMLQAPRTFNEKIFHDDTNDRFMQSISSNNTNSVHTAPPTIDDKTMQNDQPQTTKNIPSPTLSVILNSHNECICPKCDASLSLSSNASVQQCPYCKTYFKIKSRKENPL